MDLLGERLTLIRGILGKTQLEMSRLLFVSRQIVSEYENNHTRPSNEVIHKYAELSGKSVEWILSGTNATMSAEEQRIVNGIKEPIVPIYRAGQQLEPKFQFSQQQLLEIIKLKGTNPFLYSILESVMELNNKLADKLETMEKQQNKSMQKE